MIPVSMVVYWMMILLLKQSDTSVNGSLLKDDILNQNKCVNGGLLNDDILIETNVSMVVYWMTILWFKQMCQ